MKRMRAVWAAVLIVAVITIALTVTIVRKEAIAQSQNDPVLDYEAAKSGLVPDKQKEKNRRFNHKDSSTARHKVSELPSHVRRQPSLVDWWVELSALPVEKADAVVVGTVGHRQVHLSEDGTRLYTEYEVKIEQILKDVGGSLRAGENAPFVRYGGKIRFKSGKVENYGIVHYGVPHEKGRYLLFLNRENGVDLFILTGYLLSDNKVIPLDGSKEDGFEEVLPFNKYLNADEATLLRETSAALKGVE